MAFAQWRGQRRRHLALIVGVVCIFGCFLTLERGVWIAALSGTVIAALATRSGRRWLAPGLLGLPAGDRPRPRRLPRALSEDILARR